MKESCLSSKLSYDCTSSVKQERNETNSISNLGHVKTCFQNWVMVCGSNSTLKLGLIMVNHYETTLANIQ